MYIHVGLNNVTDHQGHVNTDLASQFQNNFSTRSRKLTQSERAPLGACHYDLDQGWNFVENLKGQVGS